MSMKSVNRLCIPRNSLIERAIQAVIDGDLGIFDALGEVLTHPFEYYDDRSRWRRVLYRFTEWSGIGSFWSAITDVRPKDEKRA